MTSCTTFGFEGLWYRADPGRAELARLERVRAKQGGAGLSERPCGCAALRRRRSRTRAPLRSGSRSSRSSMRPTSGTPTARRWGARIPRCATTSAPSPGRCPRRSSASGRPGTCGARSSVSSGPSRASRFTASPAMPSPKRRPCSTPRSVGPSRSPRRSSTPASWPTRAATRSPQRSRPACPAPRPCARGRRRWRRPARKPAWSPGGPVPSSGCSSTIRTPGAASSRSGSSSSSGCAARAASTPGACPRISPRASSRAFLAPSRSTRTPGFRRSRRWRRASWTWSFAWRCTSPSGGCRRASTPGSSRRCCRTSSPRPDRWRPTIDWASTPGCAR